MVSLLREPINNLFFELANNSKTEIKLCAPFVKQGIIQNLYVVKKPSVAVECISNFNLPNFYKKSSDIEAFETLMQNNGKIFNCQMLHAKLYIFDRKQLIITSANLTISGFRRNLEYGVFMDDAELVDKALEDYDSICSNETTGKIRLSNINEIKNVLRTLPEYHEYIPADDTENNEIDNIIPINKEVVTQQLSLWKKTTFLVVDGIEKNEFCLEDVYRQEQIFMQKFPGNHTVKDSIRRNLQELRDLGLIKFLGNGRYKKLWK